MSLFGIKSRLSQNNNIDLVVLQELRRLFPGTSMYSQDPAKRETAIAQSPHAKGVYVIGLVSAGKIVKPTRDSFELTDQMLLSLEKNIIENTRYFQHLPPFNVYQNPVPSSDVCLIGQGQQFTVYDVLFQRELGVDEKKIVHGVMREKEEYDRRFKKAYHTLMKQLPSSETFLRQHPSEIRDAFTPFFFNFQTAREQILKDYVLQKVGAHPSLSGTLFSIIERFGVDTDSWKRHCEVLGYQ